jgi:hypothetical protein
VLILRTSDSNRQAYKGFQWPESGHVEAPDWNPTPVCGYGLHGLAHGRGQPGYLDWYPTATWQVVEVEDELVVDIDDGKVKFPSGEVVYSGEMEGALALIAGGTDKIREWVCQDAQWAYRYALRADETRNAALADPFWAYCYAKDVDKAPRGDTRGAACKDPRSAYLYARWVDVGPRDDTRAAAGVDSIWKRLYSTWEVQWLTGCVPKVPMPSGRDY